ncbi:hypothetical protein CANDROIZ_300001 [Candidatus Roizmanbacteria bacterium]|nr:hypothetical protein CANDROIZ_300001 [Candidatus Roizmanbacteria bacterium]
MRHDELQICELGAVGALAIRADGLGRRVRLWLFGGWGTSGVWEIS